MKLPAPFQSSLAPDAVRHSALKQALGRQFEGATRVLLHLDHFLWEQGASSADLTPETFRNWSQTRPSLSASTRRARMQVVWHFCLYRRRGAPDGFVPDPGQFPKAGPRVQPYPFSEHEVARLLGPCDALPENPARAPLRWAGTRLAIVLLYTTGLRRGELFRLTPRDYDAEAQTLLIRASKFHKSRLLPLPADLAQEVEQQLRIRRAAYPRAPGTEPLLWSPNSRDHAYTGTRLGRNLRLLLDRAGIQKADGGRPRVHDFRHSFAVHAWLRWYRAGAAVEGKLPFWAAWLGHVSIRSTYYSLHFIEGLRGAANDRFYEAYGPLIVPVEKNGGE